MAAEFPSDASGLVSEFFEAMAGRKASWIVLLPLIILLFCYISWAEIRRQATWLAESNPFSKFRRTDVYDFKSTPEEEACLRGEVPSASTTTKEPPSKEPIPNVVHFVIGLQDAELSFAAYLSIRSALQSLQPETVKLHHTSHLNAANKHIQRLARHPRVQLVQHDGEALAKKMTNSTHYAHFADVLRLEVLQREGGIYLDADVYVLKSFDKLRSSPRDVVLGHEGGDRRGLCNAIILARPDSDFINRWIDSYSDFQAGEWNHHSVILPKKMAEQHPNEVCTLAPHVFFWPTWTPRHIRWMHENLGPRLVRKTERTLERIGGGLYGGQLAYHAWNSLAWKEHLSRLDDLVVRQENSRFNLMVRRFLDD